MSKWPKGDNIKPYHSDNGELRDIFAALAMQSLIGQEAATHQWVAHQAYKYADYMLDQRDRVNDTNNKETLINE